MTKLIQNNIPYSPITKVEIDEYSIKLFGRDNGYNRFNQNITPINPVEFKDKKQLEKFLSFVSNKTKLNPTISKEVSEAISTFNPESTLQARVSTLYNEMKDSIENKLQKAQLSNKKLLILIGEDHNSWDSFALELLALDICKKNNIDNFFAETCPKTLQIITTHKIANFWGDYKNEAHNNIICKAALKNNMLLHLVDPLNFESMEGKVTHKQRADKMNEVLLCTPGHAIFCTGATHLFDIMFEKSLCSKYDILTLNTTHQDNTLEQYEEYRAALSWDRETLDRLQKEALTNTPPNYDSSEKVEGLIDVYNMKNMYLLKDNKVTDLFIDPNRDNVLGSATQALSIVTETISAHNPDSPTLETLSAISDVYKQAEDIFDSSSSSYNKHNKIYHSLNNYQHVINEGAGLNQWELSYFLDHKNHLSDIVEINLAGGNIISYYETPINTENWDVGGHC